MIGRLTIAAALAGMAAPLAAQDVGAGVAADIIAQTERMTAAAAVTNAHAAATSAQTANIEAKMKALGFTPAAGATTIEPKGGEIEAWMLAAGTINEAAATIAQAMKSAGAGGSAILLLTRADSFDLSLPATIKSELEQAQASVTRVASHRACATKVDGTRQLAGGAVLPLAGAVLGLLKTDTTISGVDVPAHDQALINAVASQGGQPWIVPSEAVRPDSASMFAKELEALAEAREKAVECRSSLAEKATKEAPQPYVAVIDSIVARADEAYARWTATDAAGRSLLGRAAQLSAIDAMNPLVLRLAIEKAGGSSIKRSNLWTALGARAVGLTGGLVVSYRLVDPRSGSVRIAGLLTCRTALTNIKAVQNGQVGASHCGTSTAETRP